MFLNIDKRERDRILAVDNRETSVTYGEMADIASQIEDSIQKRSVAFILCDNSVGALTAYISSVANDVVPLLLNSEIDKKLLGNLLSVYEPAYIWQSSEKDRISPEHEAVLEIKNFTLYKTGVKPYPLNDALELLLTTSGSTGSPKLVRYKKGNLEANAKNVALAFGWTENERPLCDLAMNYTMGLNVINTHIYVGATVCLTNDNIMTGEYWDYIKKEEITNITNVPFGYELMLKLRFTRMKLPHLKTLAEGGGRLPDKTFELLANYAKDTGRRFVATFGTTETSARMAYLPPEFACEKTGSIGKAIPQGRLFLLDDDGKEITIPDVEGELAYSGPNVTMGYALNKDDLNKSDEFCGTYRTGDIAVFDEDGFYYIVGRKSRFLKLLSYRVSLDQCERLIRDEFRIECACAGTDKQMKIYLTDSNSAEQVISFISEKLGIYRSMFSAVVVDSIPKNESGKIRYNLLV